MFTQDNFDETLENTYSERTAYTFNIFEALHNHYTLWYRLKYTMDTEKEESQ